MNIGLLPEGILRRKACWGLHDTNSLIMLGISLNVYISVLSSQYLALGRSHQVYYLPLRSTI